MIRYLPWLLILTLCTCGRAPESAEAEVARPNILFAIADDVSFPHFGAYGTDWVETPNCDRLAARGLLFSNAHTPNPKCGPSRSILLTGRNGWQLNAAVNHMAYWPDTLGTIWEALAAGGYHAGLTGKGWAPGDPGTRNGQRRELVGPNYMEIKADPPTPHISSNDYAANFGAFLQDRQPGQPFAFWYGATEPHRAYEFQSGAELGGKPTDLIDAVPPYWPDTDSVRHDMLDYAYEIEHFDRHLGRMLDTLEAYGELDNTLIIVTADNGMPFPRVKGQLYEDGHHLPFIIHFTNGVTAPGRRVRDLVNFIDLAPTLADYCGLNSEDLRDMKPFTGRSLRPLLEGKVPADWPTAILFGKERHDVGRPLDGGYPIRGIMRDSLLLLVNYEPGRWPSGDPLTGYLNTDGSPTKSTLLRRHRAGDDRLWTLNFGRRPAVELYDLRTDPHCIRNRAGEDSYAADIEQLRTEMENKLAAQGDLRMFGRGADYEAHPVAFADQRGYYEKFVAGDTVRAGWINQSDYETVLPD